MSFDEENRDQTHDQYHKQLREYLGKGQPVIRNAVGDQIGGGPSKK